MNPLVVPDLLAEIGRLKSEVERLTAERDERAKEVGRLLVRYDSATDQAVRYADEIALWKDRYEAERRDHLATIKHADALEDECHKLERE